jgi:pyruvate dehydrogenase E1 component alpha subunit
MAEETTNPTNLSNSQLLEAYRQMLLIRRVEEVVGRAYQMQTFSGFCHLYIGQEAVAVAATMALREDDYMIVAYRDHGHAIAKGVTAEAVVAELLAKRTGTTGGRGGSMHMFDASKHFMGGWGIVGGQIPLGTGIGFGIKYKEEDRVCACFFGEGSIHQGVFHEALNLASLWDLPVVYLCENNRYAMGTEIHRISAETDLQRKAVSYKMDAAQVDGQNFFSAYLGIKEAIDRARSESRPTFLDVKTYRFRGHSMSDPAKYRTKDEVSDEQKRDPIAQMYRDLVALEVATEDELAAMDKELKAQAKAALEMAKAAEFPSEDTLYDHLFSEPI